MTGESRSAGADLAEAAVEKLGFSTGQIVQEYGWDDDVDEALREMELVGHDFFLYVDAESGRPSAVYRRRKGYNYGVIHLDVDKEK